ncbi:SPOR domain-containing protein [Aurantiacibacter gilvus]|uniref:SPOR domain-containing protein n=1 Tax=Aurantiacibacter gilvus TaxID=3139141 RepID=A0ABU9IDN7_9SPHN
MRLPNSRIVRAFPRTALTIILVAGLAGCGGGGNSAQLASVSAPRATTGPAADYPVTVGEPYTVDGTLYTPIDTMNYDEVGYLALDDDAMGYTAAHHTLAFPSYVEVTSLETGRTVLVRVERRGPVASNALIALSPAAMAQLGGNVDTPVRVRRVNPPEEHRALLRASNAAPLRMDTPMSLVNVLRRRLPDSGSAPLQADAQPQPVENVEVAASTASAAPTLPAAPAPAARPELPQFAPGAAPATPAEALAEAFVEVAEAETREPVETPEIAEAAPGPVATQPAEGRFLVQAAAFSNPDNARRAANVLGGEVTRSGAYYRVRTGPFATRGEAEASLANVRRAGYTDARILTSG